MWCVRTRSSAPRRLCRDGFCRDGALHQSLGVDPVITPAYHRVRNTGLTWSDRTRVRAFLLSLLRQFSMAAECPFRVRAPFDDRGNGRSRRQPRRPAHSAIQCRSAWWIPNGHQSMRVWGMRKDVGAAGRFGPPPWAVATSVGACRTTVRMAASWPTRPFAGAVMKGGSGANCAVGSGRGRSMISTSREWLYRVASCRSRLAHVATPTLVEVAVSRQMLRSCP
jgi:hypothetical protein